MPFGEVKSTDDRRLEAQEKGRKDRRIVRHVDPTPADKRKRARLEKSLTAWMRYLGGEAFSSPFSPDHNRVIKKIEAAINDGGLFALAMPRGHGKSTILKWATVYVLLTGRRKYVVTVAATAEMAQAVVEFVRQQITENETLHLHYPHVTTYARATDGKAIKARFQLRADGKTSGMQWSKTTLVLPEVLDPNGEPYASNGAILEGHGLTGAIRGKWKDTKTGKVLRPDFVLLDDPQTRESSESQSQCDMRERIITGDVLGLAGPRKRIAAVMPCTIVRKGDLAARFLDRKTHPEWNGETCALVNTWPTEQDGLWREYATIYKDDGLKAATAFYRANRPAMDAGAEVSWAHRVRDGEISALQTAENLLIETGEQFWAEYQNDPRDHQASQYTLTTAMICGHTLSLPRLHVPPPTTSLVGHIDINRAGLHYCLAGFDQSMTGHSPAYGKHPQRGELWPENAIDQVIQLAIYRGLKELCDQINASEFRRGDARMNPQLILIDASYMSDAVHRFTSTARYPFRVVPAIGRAAHRYRWNQATIVGRPFEQGHFQRPQTRYEPYVMANADHWREVSQRAFLGVAGEPGGFTLYHVDDPRQHLPFAEHVVAEKLTNKYQTDQGLRWEWQHAPGSHWDWGDALTGCWVTAAAMGLSTSGQVKQVKRYVEVRRCKVMREM